MCVCEGGPHEIIIINVFIFKYLQKTFIKGGIKGRRSINPKQNIN